MLSSSLFPGKKVNEFSLFKIQKNQECSYEQLLQPKQGRRHSHVVSLFFPRIQNDEHCVYDLSGATQNPNGIRGCSLEKETEETLEQAATWRWRLAVLSTKDG